MKDYVLCLADYVYQEIFKSQGKLKNRFVNGYSPGGDAQFNIDEIAEKTVWKFVVDRRAPIVVYSEDKGGAFLFNRAASSISQIITGQLDAYVDSRKSWGNYHRCFWGVP
jgi:hypothetical protein